MSRLPKSATIEGPIVLLPNERYVVLKTKNTLEIKPGEELTESQVKRLIREARIDLTIVKPKKK